MDRPILIGAVAYDPRVVPIWEGMRDYFRAAGPPIDYVLYSNYDRQVQALLDRQIDIAWNTNLAWVKVHRRTERHLPGAGHARRGREFTTVFVARTDSGVKSLADVRGKRLALGSADSAQAAILPVHFLHQAGRGRGPRLQAVAVRPRRRQARRHGHERAGSAAGPARRPGGRRRPRRRDLGQAARRGARWTRRGSGRSGPRRDTATATSRSWPISPRRSARRGPSRCSRMRYDDPQWRQLMDLEGLKRWLRPTRRR